MTRPGPRGDAGKAVLLRLTPEEHRTLSEAARRAGLGVGPFLRLIGLAVAKKDGTPAESELMMRALFGPAPRRVASRRGKT